MPVMVKVKDQDEIAVVEGGASAETINNFLTVYDNDKKVVAEFLAALVDGWWVGSTRKADSF